MNYDTDDDQAAPPLLVETYSDKFIAPTTEVLDMEARVPITIVTGTMSSDISQSH